MRDSQRSKVYRWENRIEEGDKISFVEAHKLTEKICAAYEINKPTINFRNRLHGRALYGPMHSISLPLWAQTRKTLLHELAHAVVRRRLGNKVAWHGPEFVMLLINLFSRYRVEHKKELLRSAKEARINIATSAACVKPKKI